MTTIFGTREFVEEFKTRNVVFESGASIARNGDLMIRSVLEFSTDGSIRRKKVINTNQLNTFAIGRIREDYQNDILDIIDGFESFCDWLKGDREETFSFFCDHESPLYLHGSVIKGDIVFQVFGPNIATLELRCSNTHRSAIAPFSNRFSVLAEHYRQHLLAVEKISIADIIKGHQESMEEVA